MVNGEIDRCSRRFSYPWWAWWVVPLCAGVLLIFVTLATFQSVHRLLPSDQKAIQLQYPVLLGMHGDVIL